MPTEVCEALDKYQPEYVVVWGKRLWDKMPGERCHDGEPIVVDGLQDGDGRLSLEQRQACEGDGCEPSFRRLFVGLLVSCVGKILLALNGGKNNAGFRNDCFRNLRFVNRYAGFCTSVNDNIVLNTLIVNALCPSLNSKPLFPKRRFRK